MKSVSDMKYDFDKPVDRNNTCCVKYDALEAVFGKTGLLPLWVADMDFETPDFIIDALKERLEHPVLGYACELPDYWPSVVDWQKRRNGWEIDPSHLAFVPGIVKGIGMVINVFTEPGDKIIIQPPVYHPFRLVPQKNGREIVWNPLKLTEHGYEMDLEQLESVIDGCRVLILSNPHNPAGVAWPVETLRRLAEICRRHGVIVISDEIHSDMYLFGKKHVPFATVSDAAREISITFAAPSKTFNIAGVITSYCVVPDDSLRERLFSWIYANEMDAKGIFPPVATAAAYRKGESWLEQMLAYVGQNVLYVEDFCREHIPGIVPMRPDASFLVWLDCRGLGLDHDALISLFVDKAGLALNDGAMFGPGGEGFMRMNVGTRKAVLEEAMERLAAAVASIQRLSALTASL